MDISSLLERAPSSASPDSASASSHASRTGQSKQHSDTESHTHVLPPMSEAVLQPPFIPQQSGYQSMPTRFQNPHYSHHQHQHQHQQQHQVQQQHILPQHAPQPQYVPVMAPYHPHQQSYGPLPPMAGQERRMSIPSLPMTMSNNNMPGPANKRLAPGGAHPAESPVKKKQSKWSGEEDAAIIELRGNGMKWEDISKHLPGRSAISCRLRFQNYLERRSEWDDEKKNKLARLYERFKKDMWEKIAKEMQLPWRAAEAMHWQIGEVEMASRANVPVFHLANPSSQSQSQSIPPPQVYAYSAPGSIGATDSGSNSTSPSVANGAYQTQPIYPSTHNHTLPQMSQPVSPAHRRKRRNSASSMAGAENRNRADSARDTTNNLNPLSFETARQHSAKRYLSPFADRAMEIESN